MTTSAINVNSLCHRLCRGVRGCGLALAFLATPAWSNGPAPFDLAGPTMDMVVTRGAMILPASEVPHLATGDRLWIKPAFPKTQSAHYLMVVAFLSGPTNPPPESWFYPCKTWKGDCARDGLTVTVPEGAQQALVFMAPETSGDFKGIVAAVRGQPGAFVRATQDLNQAQLDRSRLERYLEAVHRFERANPQALKETAPLLARSLAIKVDERCLDRIPQLQAACLTQDQDALILNDGHSMSIAQTLTSGPVADLVMAASATPELGYGVYSPYIASVLDIVRIFDAFSTAQYQYIPALVSHRDKRLSLTLNTPPSFNDPKSVLVVGLPAIEPPHMPPLRAVNPADIFCASSDQLVLPVEGAPLAFSTHYAHDITLALEGGNGRSVRLPAIADAAKGGYVVHTSGLRAAELGESLSGRLEGYWGFDRYRGPSFQLSNARNTPWTLSAEDEDGLVVGRPDTIHLRADSVSCVDDILLRDANGKDLRVDWRVVQPGQVSVTLPLENAEPGGMTVLVSQSGDVELHPIPIQVYASAARLDDFRLHAGDTEGVLNGKRLDQVASLELEGAWFLPGTLSTEGNSDGLSLNTPDTDIVSAWSPRRDAVALAELKDGRRVKVPVVIEPPRPRVSLIGKHIARPSTGQGTNIVLDAEEQLPQNARMIFSLRAASRFPRDQVIDVAAVDESFSTTLSLADGDIRLENRQVAMVFLEPTKQFGFSAFGPLKFRPRIGDVAGDWQPLATLVRLPQLAGLECPADPARACKLSGSDLFLVEAVAGQPSFDQAVKVSDGYPGASLPVPHPDGSTLYLRLRDDPSVVTQAALEVRTLPPPVPITPAKPAADAAPAPGAERGDVGAAAVSDNTPSSAPAMTSTPDEPTPAEPAPKQTAAGAAVSP